MMRNNHLSGVSQDGASRISRSKSRNQITISSKKRQKESGWNQRFHLQHIPEYNYQNEPHSQYLKNKLRIPRKGDRNERDLSKAKKIHEPSLDKNKVGNKPNNRRNEERQKEAISKAFTDLKELWYEKTIPECHMQVMTKIFNRENYPMKILEDIKHQFSEIMKQTSLVQKVMSSIETRESCLQKIMQVVKQWQSGDLPVAKFNRLFEDKVNSLRILTVHCIECIYQWKQSIQHLLPKNYKLKYIYNGKCYLSKIIDDYNSMIESKLNQIYQFDQKKHDYFLLNYTFESKKMSVVSKSIVKRIRLCQMLLGQRQATVQQEQQTKRTPLIHKVRSPQVNRQDKSMPPKAIVKVGQKWIKVQIQYSQFNEYFLSSLSKSPFNQSFKNGVQMARFQQITIFQNVQTQEEVVLGVDKNASQRKIIIFSIKSTLETVQVTLKSLCQYIWIRDSCTQIRVSLLHHQYGQALTVDLQLQKRLKAVGFRWVSVNHSNQARLTIYSIKRPLDTIAHKTARRKQAYPVVIQHLCLLNLKETTQKRVPSKCIASVFGMLDLLKQQKKQEYQQICRRDEFSHHLQCMTRIEGIMREQAKKIAAQNFETKFTYSGMKAFEIDNQETAQKIFRNLQIRSDRVPKYYPNYLSLVNTSFKFRHTTITHEKFIKFLPNKQTQILICESNYPIYLLQSDEEIINFFIIQVQETFSMESIDHIFHAMGEQSTFKDDFWLPVFHKTVDYVDEVGFRSTQIISTDYWTSLSSLKRKNNKKRTKIIKPPFVFGLIHKQLLAMLQIPFYCTLVRKEDLI